MVKETLEAKLRNQLGPAYSLASMVVQLEHADNSMKEKLLPIIISNAKVAIENEERIKLLLGLIDDRLTIEDLNSYCSWNGHVDNRGVCLICKEEIDGKG